MEEKGKFMTSREVEKKTLKKRILIFGAAAAAVIIVVLVIALIFGAQPDPSWGSMVLVISRFTEDGFLGTAYYGDSWYFVTCNLDENFYKGDIVEVFFDTETINPDWGSKFEAMRVRLMWHAFEGDK